jgi:hypothetical protein
LPLKTLLLYFLSLDGRGSKSESEIIACIQSIVPLLVYEERDKRKKSLKTEKGSRGGLVTSPK